MPPPGQGIAMGHDVQSVSEAGQVDHDGREKWRAGPGIERAFAGGD